MPGKMNYFQYTSDDGNTYSVKVRRYYGLLAPLGFATVDLSDPIMPRGMKPRAIYVQDPTGGAVRSVPVGAVTADAWNGTATTLAVDYSGIGTTTTANIIGKRAERPARVAHAIVSVSDAA